MTCLLVDAKSPETLIYDTGDKVVVFDTTYTTSPKHRTIIIRNNTLLEWYSLTGGEGAYNLDIKTESGTSLIRSLLLAKEITIESGIHSTLAASHTTTDIHIIALVGEGGYIMLNGIVEIQPHIEKVSGHILEENIFLGSKGQIRGVPSLLVHSDDVEAGHAARIERISDEKLYYLRARGIPRDDATVMMIRSAVFGLFSGLDETQKTYIMDQVIAILQ